PGPWHLGKFSYLVNIWACLWTLFVSIIFLCPTVRPTTAENMNYAVVFLSAILVFATAYWFAQGRKWYTGPLIEAEINENSSQTSDEDLARKSKGEKEQEQAMRGM
ncbi:polyamine transporter tpo5, partial [Oleoguttula sp. CCFEE 5521]